MNRSYSIIGEINESSLRSFLDYLQNNVDDSCPGLSVLINSRGGEVAVALAWGAILRSLPCKICTWNIANVDSAAILVFAAGDQRFCTPYSSFFFHQAAKNVNGVKNAAELREMAAEIDMDTARMTAFLQERTGHAASEWRMKMDNNILLSAAEAVKEGIATGIQELSVNRDLFTAKTEIAK